MFDAESVVHPSFESEVLAEVVPWYYLRWCLGVGLASQCGVPFQCLEGDLIACGLVLRLKTGLQRLPCFDYFVVGVYYLLQW